MVDRLPRHFLLYRKSNCYWRSNSILFRTPKRLSSAAQQLVEFVALSVSRESLDELAVQFQPRFFPSPQTHDVCTRYIRWIGGFKVSPGALLVA